MYILEISRGFMSPQDPVLGNFEAEQAYALKRAGHKVVFISIDRRIMKPFKRKIGISKQIANGMPVYNLYLPLYAPVLGGNPLMPNKIADALYQKAMCYLYKHVQKDYGKPDIIHAHYLFNAFMAIPLKTIYNIPLVVTEHWSHINSDILHPRVKLMGDAVYVIADKVISVSIATSERLKQHFNIESPVIYNMVDTSSFKYILKNEDKLNTFGFVTVGRNTTRKGFDLLVKAFQKAKFKDNVTLDIIGSGDWSNIAQLIDEYGLQKQITLHGPIERREDVVNIMRRNQVFVLPSRRETFGVVYIEAISMGMPVIATPCGGPEEYINETNGMLVPINDIDALADAMKKIMKEFNSYDFEKLSNDIKQRFSPEVIVNQIITLFRKVIYK